MVYRSVKSKHAFYLFIASAILVFIQAIAIMGTHDLSWRAPLFALFGALFLVAAGMARFGIGYAGVTQRSVGGGWAVQSVEYADACICGFTMGFAVFMFTIFSIPFPQGFPGGLAGILAVIAGIFALRNALKQGVYGEAPGAPPIPYDAITCQYCGKQGISPQAVSCPNCGQPIRSNEMM